MGHAGDTDALLAVCEEQHTAGCHAFAQQWCDSQSSTADTLCLKPHSRRSQW